MQLLLFLLALALFIGLILVHEWGHFIVARRNGVDVEEFGLGFPPRIGKGKKLKSGMILSLNWLPLGGFVKLKGEHDYDHRKGSFGAASVWVKTKILLAGVGMNLLTGLVILTALAWIGMPKIITQDSAGQDQFTVASDTKVIARQVRVGTIVAGSPAAQAGLRGSDLLKSISNGPKTLSIQSINDIHNATQKFGGQPVIITYERNRHIYSADTKLLTFTDLIAGARKDAGLQPNQTVTKVYDPTIKDPKQRTDKVASLQQFYQASQDFSGDKVTITYLSDGQSLTKKVIFQPRAYLGIEPTYIQIQRSTWSAPVVAVGFTKQLVVLTFKGLGDAFSGLGSTIAGATTGNHAARENGQSQATSQVGGPVAIATALWGSGSLGINFVLWLIAVISLTLALINVLPIPALDGGRIFLIWLSRGLLRRPLSRLMEERLVGASMLLLLGLMALITAVDVHRYL